MLDDAPSQQYQPSRMSSPEPVRPRLHLAHVDGLRALAALMVFVNHAFAQAWTPGTTPAPERPWSLFSYSLVTGHLSVTVFIVISGFCLALPVVAEGGGRLPGGVRRFLERRSLRILPPYYAAVVLSLALIATVIGERTGTLWDVPLILSWVSIVSHLFLVQNLFATGSINYVFWSIAVEFQIYLLFPALLWLWRRIGPLATIAVALLLGYALGLSSSRISRANPHFVGMFMMGVLAAHVALSESPVFARARRLPWGLLALSALVVAGVLIPLWGVETSTYRFRVLDLPVAIMATGLLVVSSRPEPSAARRLLGWKPLAFLGTFSYSLYLIHAPLLQVLWQYVLNPLGFARPAMFVFLLTVGLAVVLLCAYLFFLAIEAPFLRSARARRGSPAPLPAG